MNVTASHTYAAPLERVLDMLTDPAATAAKYESLGHRDVHVLECERSESALRIRSSRVVDVALPSFARKVLKPTNTMVQTDEWRKTATGWEGSFEIAVTGSPVQLRGTMRLEPGDASCVHHVTVSVTVKVPLVGGRIAAWAADNDVRRNVDGEFTFGDRWLADHRAAAAPDQ